MGVQSNEPIRVVLADDHPIVMAGFAMTLGTYGIQVVGEATTPDDAVKKYVEMSPDVLILDIRFGAKLTGIDVAKEVIAKNSDAKIVFLTQFDQDNLIQETYRIGCLAFVTKDCDPDQLAAAVRSAAKGDLYFMPQIAARLASLAVRGDKSPRTMLSARELDVFVLMAKGMTNGEIAATMGLSLKTISNVAQYVKETLGVHRAADITLLAVKHGLIEP